MQLFGESPLAMRMKYVSEYKGRVMFVLGVDGMNGKEAVLKTLSRYKQGEINLNHAVPGNFTMEAIKEG